MATETPTTGSRAEPSGSDGFYTDPPPNLIPPGDWEADERRLELARDTERARTARIKWTVIGMLVLVAVVGWFFRWQPIEIHSAQSAYLLHRWTGEVQILYQDERNIVPLVGPK